MYSLYASRDFGATYKLDSHALSFDELKPRMDFLDGEYIRWYIEKDGVELTDIYCAVWRGHLHYVGIDV